MYKPNGEERMSWLEEKAMRESIEAKRLERVRNATAAEALRSSIYSILTRTIVSRDEAARVRADSIY